MIFRKTKLAQGRRCADVQITNVQIGKCKATIGNEQLFHLGVPSLSQFVPRKSGSGWQRGRAIRCKSSPSFISKK